MGKKGGVYIVIMVLTVGLLMLMQYTKPKEVNWFPSYVSKHKIPYGTVVLNDILQQLFGDKTKEVNIPPFEFLNDNSDAKGTYFFVNDQIEFGETELYNLLDWVSEGNRLFISADNFEEKLLDTLELKNERLYSGLDHMYSHKHQLVNPLLNPQKEYLFEKDNYATYFQNQGDVPMTIIGTMTNTDEDEIKTEKFYNVIKRSYGEGEVILSTFPKAFTNYFILKEENRNYTAGLLSYLDSSRTIYIDNYYKSGKSVYTSPMYIFLNTKEFKWAYYLVLIGVVLYIVFQGKRKQRPIPVVLPLKNQTLAFTRTIADMYYEKGDSKAMAEHKIDYFMEYIRSKFYLGSIGNEKEFYHNLAARSSHSPEEIEKLFSFIEHLRNRENTSNDELQKLNSSIEKFKKQAHGK
ncbi:DUF4350 domain-containing protein [Pseudozobellia sp. WGM2]|uniref:DUF4350 domain-containing protein n=1 Tax=Pseudozobellia sp. WGM2 TaxID=2787625 RepID=UPI001ADF0A5D|nr:DUF4350 domain-containing protein [Pseudozobellia sp. WGM2]